MSAPVGLPGLAALALGFFTFLVALIVARRRSEVEVGGERSYASLLGIVVQGAAIACTATGHPSVTLDPLGTLALVEATAITLLMATTVALFSWASATMGRNWSLVARTRRDHDLVRSGPFAHVRHPIYTALFLMMLALAIGFGHVARLWWTVPLYALGTWLRVREEERLLRARFGPDYDAYSARVKRFVPRLF